MNLVTCPYNPSHKMKKNRLEIHEMTCPNKPSYQQVIIQPSTNNAIQNIRSSYLKNSGGIQEEKTVPGFVDKKTKKKRKNQDLIVQMNYNPSIDQDTIENKNYADLLELEYDPYNDNISLGTYSNKPFTINTNIKEEIVFDSNTDTDYDPNRDDFYIHPLLNKNQIPISFIESIMSKQHIA